LFSSSSSASHRALLPFPTRRSSDLVTSQRSDWLTLMNRNLPSVALGYRYEVQLGKMLDEKKVTGEHLRPYLRNVDIQWGNINVEDRKSTTSELQSRENLVCRLLLEK